MNANHARPMLAFWLVAAVAAVVTSFGLHDGGSRVSLRAGSPLPVRSPDSSPLVLGGDLRPVPTLAGTPTPGVTLPSMASLQDAAGRTGPAAGATVATLADSAKTAGPTTTRTRASSTTTTRPTPLDRPGGSTSGATATTSPTAPAPGHGHGHGHGSLQSTGQAAAPGHPGRGHGPTAPGNSGH